jgi:hypothetical protein
MVAVLITQCGAAPVVPGDMQFFGYLRRNPDDPQDTDYTGYDFWLTKLNEFSGNFRNAEMVKAFINSTEYRQRFRALINYVLVRGLDLGSLENTLGGQRNVFYT